MNDINHRTHPMTCGYSDDHYSIKEGTVFDFADYEIRTYATKK